MVNQYFFKLGSLDYFFDNLSQLINLQFLTISTVFSTKDLSDPLTAYYLTSSKEFYSHTQELHSNLISSFNEFKFYEGFSKSRYQSFLIPLFQGDACQINNENVVYQRNTLLDNAFCTSAGNGIYTQGLLFGVDQYLNFIDIFMEGVYQKDFASFKEVFEQMQNQLTQAEENQIIFVMFTMVEIIHNFCEDIYLDQYELNVMISSLLVIIQMIILLIVMVFGWRRFYHNLGEEFYQTKQLLDLIDVSILLDSPYVLSFFKRNHSV